MFESLKGSREIVSKLFAVKKALISIQHTNIAHQVSSIGSCVKSDHFKDFYEAKSYLSLQREIEIKTMTTRKLLLSHLE